MIFKSHSELKGLHAYLSPSSHAWLNYTKAKLITVRKHHWAKLRGTRLHETAERCIRDKIRLEENGSTLSMYVNDCIAFGMRTEQPLFYSRNCFGTADAISFRDGRLLIFDLKSGEKKASMDQLLIYAALFCLEYHYDPTQLIDIELRIYQSGDIIIEHPTYDRVLSVMGIIVTADDTINETDSEDGDHE